MIKWVERQLATSLTTGNHHPPPGVKVPMLLLVHFRQVTICRFIFMTKRGTLTYLMTVNLINSAASKILLMELISK